MKILVIDDDPAALDLIQLLLTPVADCDTADSGAEGLRLFETALATEKPYQLVFLDILMPEMDGHEVLKQMRALEKDRYPFQLRAKIAMMTAAGNGKNRFTSFKEGCDYYASKPIIKNDIQGIVTRTREWFELLYNQQT
jgi:two-component system, chemotaxis family, chemotaxis protein CheY